MDNLAGLRVLLVFSCSLLIGGAGVAEQSVTEGETDPRVDLSGDDWNWDCYGAYVQSP